jgi:hypothetical protein
LTRIGEKAEKKKIRGVIAVCGFCTPYVCPKIRKSKNKGMSKDFVGLSLSVFG